MNWNEFRTAAEKLGVGVSEDALEKLSGFEQRLYAVNERSNLTRVPQSEAKTRHFLDAVSISPHVPVGSSVIDIGSGAGFPGVPLAIVRADLEVTLLDAATKEIRFLESVAEFARVGLILGRAEEIARNPEYREKYDVVTGRAVAPLPTQAEFSAAFVKLGGLFIPQRAETEAIPDFAVLGLEFEKTVFVDVGGVRRQLPIYRKSSETPDRFPRTWSAMKKRPLG